MFAATIAGPLIEIDRCNLPQEAGPCRAARPSWSYDPVTRECQSFLYGGICTLYFFFYKYQLLLYPKVAVATRTGSRRWANARVRVSTELVASQPCLLQLLRGEREVFFFCLIFFVLSHFSFFDQVDSSSAVVVVEYLGATHLSLLTRR